MSVYDLEHEELPKSDIPAEMVVRLTEVVNALVETYVEDYLSRVHAFNAPLITCKDCKYYSDHEWIIATDVSDVCHFWHGKPTKVEPDGFCAWACSRTE